MQNVGVESVMAYNVLGADKSTQDLAQVLEQNNRTTTFTSLPASIIFSASVQFKQFDFESAGDKQADGWTT